MQVNENGGSFGVCTMHAIRSQPPSTDRIVKSQSVVDIVDVASVCAEEDDIHVLKLANAINTRYHLPVDNQIIASPYNDPQHQLDLTTIDLPLQRFAQALTGLQTTCEGFATAPYEEAFNWEGVVRRYFDIEAQANRGLPASSLQLFVIVFRSRISATADRPLLGQLDKASHLEAVQSGGLLKYWFGVPDKNGRNLATCLWRNRDDARAGGSGPGHVKSMLAARKMYEEWYVERHRLTIDGDRRSWDFSSWSDETKPRAAGSQG